MFHDFLELLDPLNMYFGPGSATLLLSHTPNPNSFVTRKNQLYRIFAEILPRQYRFSGISNPQRFLRYLFSFPRYWDNIGLNIFFNCAHI